MSTSVVGWSWRGSLIKTGDYLVMGTGEEISCFDNTFIIVSFVCLSVIWTTFYSAVHALPPGDLNASGRFEQLLQKTQKYNLATNDTWPTLELYLCLKSISSSEETLDFSYDSLQSLNSAFTDIKE